MIVATDFSREAVSVLSQRWPDARMLATGSGPAPATRSLSFRSIVGGLLVQDRDRKPANTDTWQRAAGPDPSESTIRDAAFTATVVKHLKSNAVAIGADRRLLGGGPGQVDRVGACRLAIERAGSRIQEMNRAGHAVVAASDAFFPFPDGPLLLIEAGIACIVQPGGSKRDEETLALCEERGVSCLLTGVRHFRH